MQFVAAFCSHQAWSLSMSARSIEAKSTHRGSVGNCKPRIFFCQLDMLQNKGGVGLFLIGKYCACTENYAISTHAYMLAPHCLAGNYYFHSQTIQSIIMRVVPFIITAAVTIGLITVLNSKLAGLPPLGKFLSPSHGFWQNAEPADASFSVEAKLGQLNDKVDVYLDERLVPHVFAQNSRDAYMVQGYLHAKFRLWQMEFQTHAAAGRLCEILGETRNGVSILEKADRKFRRLGMVYAAERAVAKMNQHPEIKEAVEAYTIGVNAYISQLKPSQYPIEYKLLDYAPEAWTPLKCALFLQYMSLDLSNDQDDFAATNTLHQLGLTDFEKLFPRQADSLDPILPKGTPFELKTPVPLKPAQADSLYYAAANNAIAYETPVTNPNNGSNNWVVGPGKTADSAAILCNDPHLGLNLPSLWYEIQLHTPDYNVYGVSFPGAPAVVIGFNDSIAWGVTNAMRDVMDFYDIQWRDSTMNEYWYNGEWVKTEWRNEVIGIRGGADYIDKIPVTVWGPVMYDGTYQNELNNGHTYAIKWMAHEGGTELNTFIQLNKAKNYSEYLSAIRNFICPGQNFVFASKRGTIAWWQQATFPAKWRRQGDFVMPGIDSTFAWQGFIAEDDNVHMVNPERGFVSSANQFPADTSYPFYLGGFHDVYRGYIINRKLRAMSGITVEDMMQMQTDNYNVFGEIALPYMQKQVDSSRLTEDALTMLGKLRDWDYRADTNSVGMTVFFRWWQQFKDTVFRDDIVAGKALPAMWPGDHDIIDLLKKDTSFQFADLKGTSAIETVPMMLAASLNAAASALGKEASLAWGSYKDTRIGHLLQGLPAFSRMHLPIGGGAKIINATTGNHGPSWRVIVQMSSTTKAYGVYPGGQQGNPGSRYYDQFVDTWAAGKYYPLWIMHPTESGGEKVKWTMHFTKG